MCGKSYSKHPRCQNCAVLLEAREDERLIRGGFESRVCRCRISHNLIGKTNTKICLNCEDENTK